MPAVLEIVPPADDVLPTCSLHLMPFHIKYTGPAPISTYFRPKPAPAPSFGKLTTTKVISGADLSLPAVSTETTLQTADVTSQATDEDLEIPSAEKPEDQETMSIDESAEISPPGGGQLVAAFRGRAIHGTKAELPQGYSGILLETPEDKGSSAPGGRTGKAVKATRSTSVGRQTRSSRRVINVEEEVDDQTIQEDEIYLDNTIGECDDRPTRPLNLVSTFSSIVVWNPDVPVDANKDEYLRSLNEWTKLAAEIHHFDY